jgi:thiol:disulfide interchange protein DsbD
MVGLGLAFPYLLLTWSPPLMRFLPKPGAWMEHFKVIVGFAAMGAAIWLFTIALDHYGDRSLWLGMFLLLVALAAWVFGQFYQRTTERRAAGLVIAVLLLAGSYAFVLEGPLNWRHSQPPNVSSGAAMEEGGIAWQPWSHEAVEAARREGRVVFVDFTAKWCTTCQANKRTSIEVASVREKLKALGAVTLLGDYTRVPDDITRELKRFGRAGVPLVLVYPKDGPKPPLVLPELLTPSIVLAALDAAVR